MNREKKTDMITPDPKLLGENSNPFLAVVGRDRSLPSVYLGRFIRYKTC